MKMDEGEDEKIRELFSDKALYASVFEKDEKDLPKIFNSINNYPNFKSCPTIVPKRYAKRTY